MKKYKFCSANEAMQNAPKAQIFFLLGGGGVEFIFIFS
jgi:hypothetical protein